MIYHVATEEDWATRTDADYRPAGLAVEGFVHCSVAGQLAGVLDRYYRDRSDLLLLTIDPAGLTSDLIWEDTSGRGERFPHIYGPIDLAAVTDAAP
ncbi:MAG: DUF952 domain-containing protein, partial [Actinomycetota bacterium]